VSPSEQNLNKKQTYKQFKGYWRFEMKNNIKRERNSLVTNKLIQESFRTNDVRINCGRFHDLPPPDDEGG
jgi:hypothetical protein